MTFKVVFMAMREASNHPWKERGNAERMHCIVKGHECHTDIEGHQRKATCNYSLTESKPVTEELLMALISPQPRAQDFLLVSFSMFPSYNVYLLPSACSHVTRWAPIPIC